MRSTGGRAEPSACRSCCARCSVWDAPRLISPDALAAAPYAYAAVAPPGGLVFTAGACPLDATV